MWMRLMVEKGRRPKCTRWPRWLVAFRISNDFSQFGFDKRSWGSEEFLHLNLPKGNWPLSRLVNHNALLARSFRSITVMSIQGRDKSDEYFILKSWKEPCWMQGYIYDEHVNLLMTGAAGQVLSLLSDSYYKFTFCLMLAMRFSIPSKG